MLFTIIILVLLWLFQYVFLVGYYGEMKSRDLQETAEQIASELDSRRLNEDIKNAAFINSFCIVITDDQCNFILGENAIGRFSVLQNDIVKNYSRYIYSLKAKLDESDGDAVAVKIKDEGKSSPKKLIYITSARNADGQKKYIFIESPVEPIDSTAAIIKEQLIYITVILFELAFIITMFISKRISKPLTSLTKTAESFASGDYTVKFDQSGYREIEQLSSILNDAEAEISKVSELRRDLIANVSHDLRTPLTIIKSYAEMIRDLSGDNPQKRSQHIQVIIDESDRLTALVNSIMELSKLESSARPLNITALSINDKLSEIMERYKVLNERDGYNIHLITESDVKCLADEALIEQALYNLINNAVNYCGNDKEVVIRQLNKPGCARIEIEDHGAGIPRDQIEHIFDRYYRSPRARRDVIGTGLGLSIVKEIFKQHGFPFGVSSTLGSGSTFWVEIKAEEQPPGLTNESKDQQI